jgi:hypothetical protein
LNGSYSNINIFRKEIGQILLELALQVLDPFGCCNSCSRLVMILTLNQINHIQSSPISPDLEIASKSHEV